MGDLLQQFFEVAKTIRLSPEERSAVRKSLVEHFAAFPVSAEALSRQNVRPMIFASSNAVHLTPLEKTASFGAIAEFMRRNPVVPRIFLEEEAPVIDRVRSFFAFHRLAGAMLAVMMLVSAGGTVAYAAEGAMPDSFLYRIKLGVNEPVFDALHFSGEAKARWQMQKVSRRLREAEHMAVRANLDDEAKVKIEERIRFSMDQMKQRVTSLEQKGVASGPLMDQYRALLEQHEASLTLLERDSGVSDVRVQSILRGVIEAKEEIRNARRGVQETAGEERQEAQDEWDTSRGLVDQLEADIKELRVVLKTEVAAGEDASAVMEAMAELEADLKVAREALHMRRYTDAQGRVRRGNGGIQNIRLLIKTYKRQHQRTQPSPAARTSVSSVSSVAHASSVQASAKVSASVDVEAPLLVPQVIPPLLPVPPDVPGLP